ncbi:MAG: hypothetical protein GY830_00500 [Bacteroidetes bacterium]|nr:hypothetical protein [Bacteroidota bacterium]
MIFRKIYLIVIISICCNNLNNKKNINKSSKYSDERCFYNKIENYKGRISNMITRNYIQAKSSIFLNKKN